MFDLGTALDTAIKTWSVVHTPFLSPDQVVQALRTLEQRADVHGLAWGVPASGTLSAGDRPH